MSQPGQQAKQQQLTTKTTRKGYVELFYLLPSIWLESKSVARGPVNLLVEEWSQSRTNYLVAMISACLIWYRHNSNSTHFHVIVFENFTLMEIPECRNETGNSVCSFPFHEYMILQGILGLSMLELLWCWKRARENISKRRKRYLDFNPIRTGLFERI